MALIGKPQISRISLIIMKKKIIDFHPKNFVISSQNKVPKYHSGRQEKDYFL